MANTMREAAEALVTIVLNQCGGYLSGPGFEAAQAARTLREALAQQPAQGEAAVPVDVQRVIDRLMSSDPDFDDCEDAANMLRRLTSAPPAPSVPDGWKLVPVTPTNGMEDAGGRSVNVSPWFCETIYRAMLAAAPEPPR